MKKIISLILVAVLALSMVLALGSCAEKQKSVYEITNSSSATSITANVRYVATNGDEFYGWYVIKRAGNDMIVDYEFNRYTTVEEELSHRTHSFEKFGSGVTRFIIGLSKKVLIADTLGGLATTMHGMENATVVGYWMYAVAISLQLYFDFSGYSDMAIGMGRMFGFHFLENFNYPFISKSIAEFWRRWHMSLGTWFRDYVYIPMGGNRVSKGR